MADTYRSLDEKPYTSHYLQVDTFIEYPVEKVWPHLLNVGTWLSGPRLETIAGEVGKVGHFERVFPGDVGDDVPLPHYNLRGIAQAVPFKYIALELFPERGGSYGNAREWMMIDIIQVDDLGGRTKLSFLPIHLYMGNGQKPDEDDVVARQKILGYFENLKHLIAQE